VLIYHSALPVLEHVVDGLGVIEVNGLDHLLNAVHKGGGGYGAADIEYLATDLRQLAQGGMLAHGGEIQLVIRGEILSEPAASGAGMSGVHTTDDTVHLGAEIRGQISNAGRGGQAIENGIVFIDEGVGKGGKYDSALLTEIFDQPLKEGRSAPLNRTERTVGGMYHNGVTGDYTEIFQIGEETLFHTPPQNCFFSV
jgi:hypothetical protein